MTEELRPFTAETLPAADAITRRMFGLSCRPILERILANPLRVDATEAAGELAYQKGELMGFQAAIVRRLHWNGEPFTGIVGSTLGMRPDASPVLLMHLMKATVAPRAGSRLFFGNTANPQSMKMNRLLGVKGVGPASCAAIRFAVTYWPRLARFLLPRPTSQRIRVIDRVQADAFWAEYLTTSHGLVSSRTGAELDWMFGASLASGDAVMLGEYAASRLVGYIVFKFTHRGRRAMVMDLIALRDDPQTLARLLRSAVRYLRRESCALVLECIGFNEQIQPTLARVLPFRRKTTNNSFIYQVTDKSLAATLTPDPARDWFWGPYDGDRCLG